MFSMVLFSRPDEKTYSYMAGRMLRKPGSWNFRLFVASCFCEMTGIQLEIPMLVFDMGILASGAFSHFPAYRCASVSCQRG